MSYIWNSHSVEFEDHVECRLKKIWENGISSPEEAVSIFWVQVDSGYDLSQTESGYLSLRACGFCNDLTHARIIIDEKAKHIFI